MELADAEKLCDELTDLAATGPSKDPAALLKARAILRKITDDTQATKYVRERAAEVDRALGNWFDSEERFHAVLKPFRRDIYGFVDRLHAAIGEASRFKGK